jgi:hypothetical protein
MQSGPPWRFNQLTHYLKISFSRQIGTHLFAHEILKFDRFDVGLI